MKRRTVEKLYDSLAPLYELWAELFETRARRRAEEMLGVQPGESLLEVGIGTGKQFARLTRMRAPRLSVGMDLSSGMLRLAAAQRAGATVYLCRGDATFLPFRDQTFDSILSCYVLDLLEESQIPHVLDEFRRVLTLGGRLVVADMAEQNPFFNNLWMKIYRREPLLVGGCRPIPTAELLVRCGWQLRMQEKITQGGFRTELVAASPL